MRLYSTPTTPYGRKARALILEKELGVESVVVTNLTDPDGIVRKLNPLGKVPVLEMDDGSALYDSSVIVEYLDALAEPRLIPREGQARWRTLRICSLADGLLDALVVRLLQQRRPEGERSQTAIDHEEWRIGRALAALDADVAQATRVAGAEAPRLVGQDLTLVDISLAVALDYTDLRYPHGWRDRHPGLAAWHVAIAVRPSLRETAPPT